MRKNLILILLGLIFFFNPNFKMLDILPDFAGAFLIICGLSKMYMYDGNFEDARKSAKYLLWISLGRTAFAIWANSGNSDYIVAFTFIACVLEMIFMIAMFRGLYLGLEYTLMRADCDKHIKSSSEAFTMSFIFTVISRILEFAPEICDLLKQDSDLDLSAGATFRMPIAQMKVYILGVCLVCSFILGVIYLFVTAKFWIKIILDKNYPKFLKCKYENYLENDREAFVAIRMQTVYFFFITAFIFLFDFYADGINLLPSLAAILMFCAASLYLCKFSGTKKILVLSLALPAAASSVLSYIFMTKVHLGINYTYALEALYKEGYLYLEDPGCVKFAWLLSLTEFILTFAIICLVISQMICVFEKERRKSGVPMMKILTVPAFFACVLPAAKKVMTTLEGYLATNVNVQNYVQNKASIANKEIYNSFMADPFILQFEKVSAISYYISIAAAAFVIVCVLYSVRIRRFTEGDYEKK